VLVLEYVQIEQPTSIEDGTATMKRQRATVASKEKVPAQAAAPVTNPDSKKMKKKGKQAAEEEVVTKVEAADIDDLFGDLSAGKKKKAKVPQREIA